MVTLAFLLAIGAIFGVVLAMEGARAAVGDARRPTGLLTWISSGNWPAKIGGGLLVVGVGALLRYAAINFDIAPPVKLATGIVATAVLGLASIVTGKGAAQRAVSLALGGAAFGIAYLTAYSAFALFGYVTDATGLALLVLTSIAAGVFAVTRSALSLALLAMVGAYLAPAFAIGDPGPRVIYGYYAAASGLTLLMVTARGWRPLIHLSFLFTLAGGVFFAWTSQYYTPQHFDEMWPLLMLLVALHVAMPLVEEGVTRSPWVERLDLVYLLALPAVATLLALVIAPSRLELSAELMWLGAIWLVAAVCLRIVSRDGIAAHAVIGAVLVGLGVAARFRGLPWELIALAFAVGALALAARRSTSRGLHSVLAGLVLLLGAVHVVSSLAPITDSPVFANARFLERVVGAALLIVAGLICRRVRQSLDTLLLAVGIGWAIIAIGAELVRWDLVSLALILHWLLIVAAVALSVLGLRARAAGPSVIPLAIGLAGTAMFAAGSAPLVAAWISLFAAPLSLIALAVRSGDVERDGSGRVAAASVAPIVAAVWAEHAGEGVGVHVGHFPLAAAALTALLTLIAARALPVRAAGWMSPIAGIFALAFAATLATVTLFDIARNPWAVVLELLCLGGLALLALQTRQRWDFGDWVGPASVVGAALVLQANLLRWLGPDGELTVADLTRMQWPTLVSLLWAAMGAAMTLWARRSASRTLWVSGATLLVAAAIKLILIDFGSLGELANILAVIAAGGVFLLVGWLAPMPPAAPRPAVPERPPPPTPTSAPPKPSPTPPRPAGETPDDSGSRSSGIKIGWTIALIAAAIVLSSRFGQRALEFVRDAARAKQASIAQQERVQEALAQQEVADEDSETTLVEPAELTPRETPAPAPVVEAEWPMPPAGEKGIEQLLAQRKLRPATVSDLAEWDALSGSSSSYAIDPKSNGPYGERFVFRTYVVMAPISIPANLYGAHSVTFLVPRGIPRPSGDPGHCRILEMNR